MLWSQLSLRYTLDCLLVGEDAPFSRRRDYTLSCGILFSALGVALVVPSFAEKIFAVTGATAVAMVCYVIPVVIHLRLHHSLKLQVWLQKLIYEV